MSEKVAIYGTLGPACASEEVLAEMFRNGMTGVRLNLSHVTLRDSGELIETLFKAAKAAGVSTELLIDMQGPELRVGSLKSPLTLTEGEIVLLSEAAAGCGESVAIPVPGEVIAALLCGDEGREGQEILLDDGKLLLTTVEPRNEGTFVRTRVVRGGVLNSRKSIALPGIRIDSPALTAADLMNIREAKRYGVTAVMQPFVRSAEDLRAVRAALDAAGGQDIRLFAKIENREGISRLRELIPEADEIVIARGDLGNAVTLTALPGVQKKIAAQCRAAKEPFMVVTQMLASMEREPVPTRAEVSDIFNAVLDGAASVMVTGETAVGAYPAEAVRYLAETVKEAENYLSGPDAPAAP